MENLRKAYDAIVIGGGFYGCMIALHLRKKYKKVVIFEATRELLTQASYQNQARIHNGYHYPRSPLTAKSSHKNYLRFIEEFKDCVSKKHLMIYAITKNSKTSTEAFKLLCTQINIPLIPAPDNIVGLFNADLIESVFLVEENVFNADKLRQILKKHLEKAGVEVFYNFEVEKVVQNYVHIKEKKIRAKRIINCTYARINDLLEKSSLPLLPFKNEYARMPLVKMPKELEGYGITVMDGDYFAVIPFPPYDLHTLHHVKYTPDINAHFPQMHVDISRYLSQLMRVELRDSIRIMKTVLQESETTDSRPILYRKDYGLKGFDVVLGAKIDNIYDILEKMDNPKATHLNIV